MKKWAALALAGWCWAGAVAADEALDAWRAAVPAKLDALQAPGFLTDAPAAEFDLQAVVLHVHGHRDDENALGGLGVGLAASRQGFFPLDRCTMRRVEVPAPDAVPRNINFISRPPSSS